MTRRTEPQTFCLTLAGLLFIAAGPAILTGCASAPAPATYAKPEPLCLTGTDTQTAMDAAIDVLEEMYFEIDKADAGYIRTEPLPAAQFFELWRRDNPTQYEKLEANLHTIRKTVELTFIPADNRLCIDCNVFLQRLSLPEQPATRATRAFNIFTISASELEKLRLSDDQLRSLAWLDLGRSPALENEILQTIKNRLTSKEENDYSPPD